MGRAHSIDQLEKNIVLSFSYVKKDLLNLNDSVSNVSEKIQHLSLNDAMLLEKLTKIESLLSQKSKLKAVKKKSTQKSLEFYDVKSKKKFKSNEYIIRKIKGKKMAVAVSPSKIQSYRLLGSIKRSKKTSTKNSKKTKTFSKNPKKIVTETVLYE